jgi:hypothetical protein
MMLNVTFNNISAILWRKDKQHHDQKKKYTMPKNDLQNIKLKIE